MGDGGGGPVPVNGEVNDDQAIDGDMCDGDRWRAMVTGE